MRRIQRSPIPLNAATNYPFPWIVALIFHCWGYADHVCTIAGFIRCGSQRGLFGSGSHYFIRASWGIRRKTHNLNSCYMACANTIFVRGVLLSHVGSGSRLRRRYSKGCPMKYFVQCWCCPLYWIYSLCLLSFFLAMWWKGGVRAAPTT